MHVADLDGRIYDREKRLRIEEVKFWIKYAAFLVTLAVLLCGASR